MSMKLLKKLGIGLGIVILSILVIIISAGVFLHESRPEGQAGAKADIAVIDLAHTLQTPDPLQSLMTGSSGRDVRTVFIDGRLVMHERVIPGFDEDAACARAQQQFDGLIARYPERTFGHPPLSDIFSSSYPRHRKGDKA